MRRKFEIILNAMLDHDLSLRAMKVLWLSEPFFEPDQSRGRLYELNLGEVDYVKNFLTLFAPYAGSAYTAISMKLASEPELTTHLQKKSVTTR